MKKNITSFLLFSGFILLACISANAQNDIKFISRDTAKNGSLRFARIDSRATPFNMPGRMPFLKKLLSLKQTDELRQTHSTSDDLKMTHIKFQQFFKGVKIDRGEYVIHAKNDIIESVNGNFESIDPGFSVVPAFTREQAVSYALQNIHAKKYKWELPESEKMIKTILKDPAATYYPQPELTILKLDNEKPAHYVLAYRFLVAAAEPASDDEVFVDAHTGKMLLRLPLACHITGDTRYSGTQPITGQQQPNGSFILRDATRGGGIYTRNLNNTELDPGHVFAATDFVDNNDVWSAAEFDNNNLDNAALDAQWGVSRAYDYFNTVHGRNSYDGAGAPINLFVHALLGGDRDNAGWNSALRMLGFGDGQTVFNPVVGLDICAHEFAHGVFQFTALSGMTANSRGENAAINEGFSDIWGACLDTWAASADARKNPWLIGEQVMRNGAIALRSLRDPYELGGASTYGGVNWTYLGANDPVTRATYNDAGVIGYWFYLLCRGGSRTNDFGSPFAVNGIGINSGERIIYRTLAQSYLTSASGFADTRNATINAATDLFGACSNEVKQVMNAWYAVGIGLPSESSAFLQGPSVICVNYLSPGDFSVTPVANATNYNWQVTPNPGATIIGNGSTSTIVTAYLPGSYYLSVAVTTNCGTNWAFGSLSFYAQDNVPGSNCDGGGFPPLTSSLVVSPNPARDQITITSKGIPGSIMLSGARKSISGSFKPDNVSEIMIIDMLGVTRIAQKVQGNTFPISINTSSLRNGTYIVRIIGNGKPVDKKIVIIR
ncbi:MAG TPA: M4 family metallopeptidase [Niastella sp.]